MNELTENNRKELLVKLIEVCKSNLSQVDEDMISRAFLLSFEAHKNDFRASGEPYFIHPYEVALIVASEMPLDDISVVVALSVLHRYLEMIRSVEQQRVFVAVNDFVIGNNKNGVNIFSPAADEVFKTGCFGGVVF